MGTNLVKTVFLGGNLAGVKVLESISRNLDCEILGVMPNRNDSEMSKLTESLQIRKISLDEILGLARLDLLLSVHSETIIREPLIAFPKYNLNIHFSLLPKHRGMFPLGHAILEGDKYAGVTIHKVDKGLDTGPILYQKKFPILPSDTYHTLYTKGTDLAVELVDKAVGEVVSGKTLNFREQTGESSYHDKHSYPSSEIDFSLDRDMIKKQIRSLTSPRYEAPYCLIGGKKFKIVPDEEPKSR